MTDILTEIISKEREVRNNILRDEKISLENKIMRSLGILKYATLMDSNEMMECLSYVRLGVSLGIIENMNIKNLTKVLIEARPNHMELTAKKHLSPTERDSMRAKFIKENI